MSTRALLARLVLSAADGRAGLAAAVELAEHHLEDGLPLEALDVVGEAPVPSASAPRLVLRALLVEGWARLMLGDLETADWTLQRARELAEGPGMSDLERAETCLALGCCRLRDGRVANARALLAVAAGLAERAGAAGDGIRSVALDRRTASRVAPVAYRVH